MGDNASRRAPQQVQRVRLAEVAGPVQEFLLARTEPVVLEGACSDWQAIDVCSVIAWLGCTGCGRMLLLLLAGWLAD